MKIKQLVRRNIRHYRKAAGLSQQQLADRVGMSLRYISYLENTDSNVTIEILERLAKGLGVSMADLLGEKTKITGKAPRKAVEGVEYAISLLKQSIDLPKK